MASGYRDYVFPASNVNVYNVDINSESILVYVGGSSPTSPGTPVIGSDRDKMKTKDSVYYEYQASGAYTLFQIPKIYVNNFLSDVAVTAYVKAKGDNLTGANNLYLQVWNWATDAWITISTTSITTSYIAYSLPYVASNGLITAILTSEHTDVWVRFYVDELGSGNKIGIDYISFALYASSFVTVLDIESSLPSGTNTLGSLNPLQGLHFNPIKYVYQQHNHITTSYGLASSTSNSLIRYDYRFPASLTDSIDYREGTSASTSEVIILNYQSGAGDSSYDYCASIKDAVLSYYLNGTAVVKFKVSIKTDNASYSATLSKIVITLGYLGVDGLGTPTFTTIATSTLTVNKSTTSTDYVDYEFACVFDISSQLANAKTAIGFQFKGYVASGGTISVKHSFTRNTDDTYAILPFYPK